MRFFLVIAAVTAFVATSDAAMAQRVGKFKICSATDSRCQTPGTVGLACLDKTKNFKKIGRWRNTGDAMRVRNGKWEMTYTDTDRRYACTRVLTVKASRPGRDRRNKARFCSGEDPTCQRPGMIGLTCILDNRAISNSNEWQYTGDAMRVVSGQWMMYYSHNNQTYVCESVVIGEITYRANAADKLLKVCRGDDRRCQGKRNVAVSCDIEGDGFRRPRNWHYNGRSMRVRNRQWQMLYPNQKTYNCENVVVTTVVAGGGNRPPRQPDPAPQALPSGAVILFDGYRCPRGWSRLGEVEGRRSPVFGLSYCRLD